MELVKVKCPECGANLEVNQELDEILCNYCGTKVLIDDEAAKITRIEKAKLQSRKNIYEQEMHEKREKNKAQWKEAGRAWLVVLILFGVMAIIGIIASLVGPKNPSLSDYNSLSVGMSYSECKEILGTEGHLISEDTNTSKYVWYDVYCSDEEECETIIELNFENGKLVSRSEKGLK